MSYGEEYTVEESLLFLIAGGVILTSLVRAAKRQYSPTETAAAFSLVLAAACAIHFGNYFYSGHQKLMLDGGLTDWLLTNPTYYLMPAADGLGTLIFSDWPSIRDALYRQWTGNFLLMNFTTLMTQLAALATIMFLPTTRIMLVAYDAFHAGVAALSGIVFYFWMSLNVAFATAMGYLTLTYTWAVRALLGGLLLASTYAFAIFHAGWYETRAQNRITIDAVTETGESARVSPRRFLFASYLLYTDAVLDYDWKQQNAFPTVSYGTAYNSEVRRIAEGCALPSGEPNPEVKLASYIPALIKALHPLLVEPRGGLLRLIPYPHHFLEAHDPFEAFNRIDARKIVGYRFTWEATCFGKNPDRVEKRVLATGSAFVGVEGAER
jgi:hypothetical protein